MSATGFFTMYRGDTTFLLYEFPAGTDLTGANIKWVDWTTGADVLVKTIQNGGIRIQADPRKCRVEIKDSDTSGRTVAEKFNMELEVRDTIG